jgi:hypothetical protein
MTARPVTVPGFVYLWLVIGKRDDQEKEHKDEQEGRHNKALKEDTILGLMKRLYEVLYEEY